MQEQNNEKIVALSFRSAKVTSDVLVKILKKFLALQKNRKPKIVRGKQSLKKLIHGNENASVTNIDINDKNIKAFEKTARKYGIDYSLKKDKSTDPPQYTIYFRAKDSEIMTKAFKDFLNSHSEKKEKKPSILKRLNNLVKIKNKERKREKTKVKEAEL